LSGVNDRTAHEGVSKPVRVIGRVRDDVPGKRPRGLQEAASALPKASVEGSVEGKIATETFDFLPFFIKLYWLIFVK
jgi:hypothetical protein